MRDAPQTKFTPERKAIFLAEYERLGEKKSAAAAAGVTRQTIYDHIATDPEFARQCEAARDALVGDIVNRLRHCAIEGTVKKTYDKDGNKVSETRVYDARLMLAWLKRLERDKWGDKVAVDQTVTTKAPETKVNDIPRAARDKLREALRELRREAPPSAN